MRVSDDKLRKIGPYVALVGVALSVLISWLVAGVQSPSRYSVDDVWAHAAVICTVFSLLSMGAGMFVTFLPEFRRSGPFARRLVCAERRNMVAGRGIIALAAWLALLGSGCMFFVLCASYGFEFDGPAGLRVLFFVIPIMVFVGISVFAPVVVAASAAVGLSGSRRTGGARDLLLAPPAADHLGWAAIKAHSLRSAWILLAAGPYYAAVLLTFAGEVVRDNDTPMLITALVLLPLTLLVEYWQLRTAAAVGAWAGAAIMIPGLAAVLSALIVIAAWFARFFLLMICVAISVEAFRGEDIFEFWFFPALFVPAMWCLCTMTGKIFRWACRRSMTLPWVLRLGGWMLRKGQALVGFGGEGVENLEEVIAGIDPQVLPSEDTGHYKTGLIALWGLVFAAIVAFLVAGNLHYDIRSELRYYMQLDVPNPSTIANWTFYITLVMLNLFGMGILFLFKLVRRQIGQLRKVEAVR